MAVSPSISQGDRPSVAWLDQSEMGQRIVATDWSRTPLGPIDSWSPTLRATIRLMLANRFPHILWWGPEFVQFYNDAYIPIPGTKHPKALGQAGRECWPEIWHIIGPLVETPFSGGPATWMDDIFLEVHRHGFVEETHFTIAYSPVPDDAAPSGIGGVLGTIHETTRQVIQERRLAVLGDLGARSTEAKTADEACGIVAEVLGRHPKDLPFALLYLATSDDAVGRLAASTGVAAGTDSAPLTLSLERDDAGWPAASAYRAERIELVENLAARFEEISRGPWSDPPRQALVLPIPSSMSHRPAGVIVLGLSARMALDDGYRAFAELVAAQVAAAIANARAYEEERRRSEALAEIDRAKTAFFSNVSHEFRTPLTLLLGPLQEALAEQNSRPLADVREDLVVALRNARRLLKLVNTLLDFSRIEANRVQAAFVPVDLASFTAELAGTFRSAIERAGLTLRVDCAPLAAPVYVDRDMWEKIVLNLLSNAFKHTFEGEIRVSLSPSSDGVLLEVRDTGVGIPAEQVLHLFERFYRVPNARSRTHEGTGIGLALVQELVRLHGGHITVASEEHVGSAFTVWIPAGTSHLPPERITSGSTTSVAATGAAPYVEEALRWLPDAPRHQEESPVALIEADDLTNVAERAASGARVLIADDNADMRAYAARLLGAQWNVDVVPDGLAALARVREKAPDLLLADVMMPGLDGFGLLRTLRADPATRETPIILLSAQAGEEARVEGLRAGADDYLVKPFSARELVARVGGTLELARVRKEAAAALRSSEETLRRRTAQFETLLAEAPLGVYLVDDGFRIRTVNPAARPFFGDIPDLIGRDLDDVIHILWPGDYADEIVRIFRHTLETGEPYSAPEHIEQRLDRGMTEYYEWSINRIPLPEGRHGVVCYFRDISAQVFARIAVAESQERLRQSAKMEAVGRLAGGLAHDFNNQLQVLLGYARYAGGDPGISARSRQDLAQVQQAAERLAELTRQLLAFSRQQVLRPELLNLDETVTEGLELLRRLIGSQIEFSVERGTGAKWVHADRTQLQQVLLNLSINARDAMPNGGRLEIGTALRDLPHAVDAPNDGGSIPAGHYVVLTVTDTGTGIATEDFTHIFEPFFTTKEVGKGTGLGLATVHGIVAQSHGYVYAESPLGQGASFTVLLPAAAPPDDAVPTADAGGEATSRAPLILLVEDEPTVRELLSRVLREAGYEVLQARHGGEALALVNEHRERVALVVTDIVMPVMGGKEFAVRVSAMHPDLRLVWMSGHPSDVTFGLSQNELGQPFLAKPVDPSVLVATVREALSRAPTPRGGR